MSYLTHLKALQALEAAVRNGSLKGAAEELGVTPAAVGQRIRALEAYLDCRLLDRGRHGIAPTAALNEALGDLTKGFHHLQQTAKTLRLDSLNLIKIVADPDWANLWLRPRLDDFTSRNPLIEVSVSEPAKAKGGDRAADFEVRSAQAEESDGQEILFLDYLTPVSSPENHKRIAKLPSDRRLEGFPLLHLEPQAGLSPALGWPEWVKRFGHRVKGADRGIRYLRVEHGLSAVRSDAGLLICGLGLVIDAIEDGSLSLPFEARKGIWTGQAYCLVSRPGVLQRPQAKKFYDWLIDQSADTRRRLTVLCGEAALSSGVAAKAT